MAAVVGALRAELSASIAKFQADMGKAAGEVRKFASVSEAQGKRISAVGSKMAGLFTGAMLVGFARNVARMASDLQDAADQLNVTTQELQGLQAIALATGSSTDKMTRALGVLTNNLGEAQTGAGALAKMMRRYGVELGLPMQVILDFADRVKNARTWTEKMAITTGLFGDKLGRELVPAMNLGADGMKALYEQAIKDGQIWDPEVIRKLDDAGDKFERLKMVLTGQFAEPFSEFLVHLTRLVESPSWKEFWYRFIGPMGIKTFGEDFTFGPRALAAKGAGAVNQIGGSVGPLSGLQASLRSQFFSNTRSSFGGGARSGVPAAPGSGNAAEAAAQKRLAWLAQTYKEAADDFEESVEKLREAYVEQASSVERQLATAQQIGDLQRRLGFGAPISGAQESLQGAQRELDTARAASTTKLRELENELTKLRKEGDEQAIADKQEEISLQQQLDTLLGATSAEQLMAAQRINDAFKNLTDSLSTSLSTMLANWEFDIESLKSVFRQFINELLIKPAVTEATGLLSSLLKGAFTSGNSDIMSLFEGGHAEGGFIRPGRWGIAGENGTEAVFGGRMGASVMSGDGGGSRGGDTYIDMRHSDVAAVKRLEGFVRSQARGERDRWKIHFAENTGSRPR